MKDLTEHMKRTIEILFELNPEKCPGIEREENWNPICKKGNPNIDYNCLLGYCLDKDNCLNCKYFHQKN